MKKSLVSQFLKELNNFKVNHLLSKKISKLFTLNTFFRNAKIQNRLISSFLVLSVIPLLITGFYSYNNASQSIKSKISTYSHQVALQINREIERTISDLTDLSENMVSSDYIQKNLSEYESASDDKKLLISNNIINYLASRLPITSYISELRVATPNDNLIYYQRVYVVMPDSMEKLKKIAKAREGIPGFSPVNLESGQKGISLAREIYSVESFKAIGILILTVVENSISDIFRDIDLGQGAEIFILDAEGTVVSSRNPEIAVNSPYMDRAIIKGISEYRKLNKDTFISIYKGKESLVTYSYVKNADWYVVCTIPFSYLNSESARIGLYTVLVALFCLLFSVILAFMITRSISTPLKRLINHMDEAKKGNLNVMIHDSCKDEIAEVSNNFDNMIEEIRILISNVRENERQKAKEKLRTLQAQINPHFLSNTLNTVKWLAMVQNAKNISNLVTSLIQLLHVSMGKGDDLITIAMEIDYIKNYITIQEYKYCDKFTVQYDIDEEILKCKIPKFTIQPVIENAIIHGIEPMEGQGTISIKGARQDDYIILTVTDNGVGFSQENLKEPIADNFLAVKKQFSGIGIRNVDERIKLLFGDKYGLDIESISNIYTKVKIRIPEVYENW